MPPTLRRVSFRGRAVVARDRLLSSLPPVRASLAIYDDVFPNLLTAFRIAEFNAYLERWPTAIVSSTNWFPTASGSAGFRAAYKEYAKSYPQLAPRVLRRTRNVEATHAYCVFINNIAEYVEHFEAKRWPFLFTLYPGGGLELTDGCAKRIERVVNSPMFNGVIVTQKVTQRWLEDRCIVDPALIHLIWGVVLPEAPPVERAWWPDKPTFDVAFVAHKYMPGGADKGYDLFVEAAHLLAADHPDSRFHVVGNWSPDDQPVRLPADRMRFYGPLVSRDLHRLYESMDVIVSPSRPFHQGGRFDGFPLGAAVEAGLRGAVVMATDAMGEGGPFGEDEMIVTRPDRDEIAQRLSELASSPDLLLRTATAGQSAFRRVYGRDAQLAPRFRLLEALMQTSP